MHASIRYFVKKPSGRRKSYQLVAYTLASRKDRVYHKLSDRLTAEVASINSQLATGTLTNLDAERLLADLIAGELRRSGVVNQATRDQRISEVNSRLFEAYWEAEYASRFLEDPAAARYKLLKAIRLIEPLSVATASQGELQSALSRACKTVGEQRYATDHLNQVIKFLKRPFKLQKPKKGFRMISFLTEAEVVKVAGLMADKRSSDLCLALFATGMRFSEAMAITPADLSGEVLGVYKQLTVKGKLVPPKRERVGDVLVIASGLEATASWAALNEKSELRWKFAKDLEVACKKANLKVITPHDLRHSHAIHWLSRGATLKQVALNLRNTMAVCEEYYVGYAHSEGTLEGLKRLAVRA